MRVTNLKADIIDCLLSFASTQLKEKLVKPTCENQKIILYKDIRSKKEKKLSLGTTSQTVH